MMKRFVVKLFLASLAVCVGIAGHAQPFDPIGVILPMTGDFARYGERVREGLESKKIDSVKFVYEDEGGNPRSAVSAFHKLRASDKLSFFWAHGVGHLRLRLLPC
jgi:hypothetical protein